MPTNSNAYNSRITDEALEKRFRDTFRSQGGAELVDDLYAQGVIVPIVDFTAAAEGSQLSESLQTAWDFSTGSDQIAGATANIASTAGFWLVDLNFTASDIDGGNAVLARIYIDDGTSEKNVWGVSQATGSQNRGTILFENKFIVFLRAGDTLKGFSVSTDYVLDVWFRQIATVSGDLVNPTGFTSS